VAHPTGTPPPVGRHVGLMVPQISCLCSPNIENYCVNPYLYKRITLPYI
jgi:hypothetical protein